MAEECEYSENDTLFVGRFVYDVLEYTLTKCGLPQTYLPNIDCAENVYHRANLVKIAGASALRLSLLMRVKWRQIFMSQLKSFKSRTENVSFFLGNISTSYSLCRTRTVQSTVELLLASCNEVLLFLHHESIDIDVIMVMKFVASYILLMSRPSQNIQERVEGLFDEMNNISLYTKSLTNFIKKYAIPYGSRYDVSKLFLERVKQQFIDLKNASPPGTLSINIVKNHLGYLPYDLFLSIFDESVLPENLASTSSSTLPDDRKSQKPTKLPDVSENSAFRGSKSHERSLSGSGDVSEQNVKSEQNIQNSPELGIEDDLGQMSFADRDSQSTHGAIPKRKKSEKKKANK